jgi:methylenetetrahydrofolate dehydrogenase (NADP+)/methenyltetrahydrofolate cyclohydrolase
MTAQIIDGKATAQKVRAAVKTRADALTARGVTPGLAVILAGDDPASATYVRNKERSAGKCGISARTIRMPATVSAGDVAGEVQRLNADSSVHGILVQLPLPSGISAAETRDVLRTIDPDKDVDGLHPTNLGRLTAGDRGFVACTPKGCMRLLEEAGVDPSGKRAVVIGRSVLVGKPMSLLLLGAHATVTMCHSRTQDLPAVVREADIVVAAVGREGFVRGDWLKPGATVIDVGINRNAHGKLCGDVAFQEAVEVAGAITPVPGGVGPMTIASLLDNTCQAAEWAAERP